MVDGFLKPKTKYIVLWGNTRIINRTGLHNVASAILNFGARWTKFYEFWCIFRGGYGQAKLNDTRL